ncbi:GyrI-like domain-containing protein [Prosthecochloris sp. HL-130-GSB]|nr:GyrI-like domain-containing protein [Prosthecochloris sp. HL-130-GSB]
MGSNPATPTHFYVSASFSAFLSTPYLLEERMEFECSFQCEIKYLVSAPAVTLRSTSPMSDIIKLFDKGYADIAAYISSAGSAPAGPPFAWYHAMEGDKVDVEFGYPVTAAVRGNERFRSSRTPGGRAVSCLYIGPYEEVEPAYDALMKCIADNALSASGEALEVYLNDPADTGPEFLKTEVSLLLEA